MHTSLLRVRSRLCFRRPLSQRAPRLPARAIRRIVTRPVPLRAKKLKQEVAVVAVKEEDAFAGLSEILDCIKWSKNENLVPVIVQHVDTGEVLMQAYADRAAISETMQTKS